MNKKVEERLPKVVEDRLQEAYESIRRGEIKQMGKQKKSYRGWMSVAAAIVLIVAVPSVVFAAVSYFQKNVRQEADRLTYEFDLNYELIPGEYRVTSGYLPDGMADQGHGKYIGEEQRWITVMPIYTTADLDKANSEIVVEGIEEVEHTTLSGMAADVITFREAEKYRTGMNIFLFNEQEGCVINVIAGYDVDREEVLKFADSLRVERTGDGSYETADEKAAREAEAEEQKQQELEGQRTWEALMQLGIPQDKVYGMGEELYTYDGAYGYKMTGYEFLDSLEGFAEGDFFEYARFDGWVNADKTLRPYKRQHYGKDGELLAEDGAAQKILRVDMEACCYNDQWQGLALDDIALDFELVYVKKTQDGAYTWEEEEYVAVPSEEYSLQMDHSAVYIDVATHTQGEDRKSFFYRDITKGETISYTLLFVVDQDRMNDFLLCPVGTNSSMWQGGFMTVKEIREELEGYIRLQ